MKAQIKKAVKTSIRFIVSLVSKTRIGQYCVTQFIDSTMEQVVHVLHEDISLKFSAPNALSKYRYETFSSKEPETLEWINAMPAGAVLWDIGANIGLYSIYAAKKRQCKIYSFEPSIFNLELLARNIWLNELTNTICIVPIALSDKMGKSQMYMTSTQWSGALSTFGETYGWDGKAINEVFKFQTIGMRMTDALQLLCIPQPDYIKMDVDGIEHLILKGGRDVLTSVKGVLIEINDDFNEQASLCSQLLVESGLVLKEKRHAEMIACSTTGFQNTYNQIWSRP